MLPGNPLGPDTQLRSGPQSSLQRCVSLSGVKHGVIGRRVSVAKSPPTVRRHKPCDRRQSFAGKSHRPLVMGWCATASDTRRVSKYSLTASIRYMSLVTPCRQMLDAFFPVLADRFHNVEVSVERLGAREYRQLPLDSGRSSPTERKTPPRFL